MKVNEKLTLRKTFLVHCIHNRKKYFDNGTPQKQHFLTNTLKNAWILLRGNVMEKHTIKNLNNFFTGKHEYDEYKFFLFLLIHSASPTYTWAVLKLFRYTPTLTHLSIFQLENFVRRRTGSLGKWFPQNSITYSLVCQVFPTAYHKYKKNEKEQKR